MKIETQLNPNCSETTFVILDWDKKELIDTLRENSGSVDVDMTISFIDAMEDYVKKGYSIEEVNNQGNGWHPAMLEIVRRMVKEKVKIDSEKLGTFISDYNGELGTQEAYDECMASMKTKAELFAAGYYGKKKKGGKSGHKDV